MKFITDRLDILMTGSVIDAETRKKMLAVTDLLFQKYKLHTDTEGIERFITHLAMADMRIKAGQAISSGENHGMQEVRSHSEYKKVLTITNDIKDIMRELPPFEEEYVQVYVCSLLD